MTHSTQQLRQPEDRHPRHEEPEHHPRPPHHHDPPPPPQHLHHTEHHRHDRHEFDVLIRALRMWIDKTNDRPSVDDLIEIVEREGALEVAEILRSYDPTIDDIYLIIEKLDVDLAVRAGHRRRELHAFAIDKRVGLLVPVPPHIHDAFDYDSTAITLLPDGEHLPPHLRRIPPERLVRGSRLCRSAIASLDIVICEAFRNSQIFVAAGATDLLDERMLASEARIVAHCRPHLKPDDEPVRDAIAGRIEWY